MPSKEFKSDLLFSQLEACLTGAFIVYDRNLGRIVYVSDQIWSLTGYEPEEWTSDSWQVLSKRIHPDDLTRVAEYYKSLPSFSDKDEWKIAFRIETKEKTWSWLELTIRIGTRDKKGIPELLVGFAQDISDVKSIEMGFMQKTSYIMALMNAIPGYVSWLKRDLTYIGVNEALAKDCGLSTDDFIGKKYGFMSEFTLSSGKNGSAEWLQQFSSNDEEKFTQKEMQISGPFGTRSFLISASKYGDEGNMVLIGVDNTRLKDLEREIEAEKVRSVHQSRMAVLGEMASGMAHEINNPLQIVMGVGDEILKRLPTIENDKDHLKKSSEMLMRSAERISKIVKSLKTFSRDGSSDPMMWTAMNDLINETVDFALPQFKKRNAILDVISFDPALGAECRSIQISQVIMNLFSNSLDAIENLEKRWVVLQLTDAGDEIEISVTDSGSGIPAEIIDKIMNPFFTTKPVGTGTGLGLSISMGILKAHRGTIGLDRSSPNTRFYLRWPKKQS